MDNTILIFISRMLCYESNRLFIAEMSDAFQNLGYQVELCEIDLEDENLEKKLETYIGKAFQAIIDFNSTLPRLQMESDERYIDTLHAPFYNYIVDHPLYHHPVIKIKLNNSNVICIDENHRKYVEQHYPNIKNTIFMPLGAMQAVNEIPYEERNIDVLFSGTYTPSKELQMEIEESDLRDDLNIFFNELKENTSLTQEEALRNILVRTGEELTNQEFADRLNSYYLADKYLRAYYREKVIQTLLENEIDVTIYGYGWERFETNHKDHLNFHNQVSFPVSLEIIAESKIVLNIMPWFKNGVHDRVLSAMANRAICVTDTSTYIEKNFIDGKNVILYSLDHLEELPGKIKSLLQNEQEAKQISECGYQEAISKHMWKNRIEDNIQQLVADQPCN
jgi:glycosyltransferase involved in cell wall biosynthesis